MKTGLQTDILIIGAGISGIGAACHLERKNKNKNYIILESRKEIGGTWSLFKYPGIRSDSDMYTFGYSFKTWDNQQSFADGPNILKYLKSAIDDFKIKDKIKFNCKVNHVNFNKSTNKWTIKYFDKSKDQERIIESSIIFSCTGYYNYKEAHLPEYKNSESFKGKIIHPQFWPKNFDYKNKKVAVIGSGATAVTLVPAMSRFTSNIVMIQRSPTYIGAFPNKDALSSFLKKILPKKFAHKLIRFKNILLQILFFQSCKILPKLMKKWIINSAKKRLGQFPVKPHFEPKYNPWDQRFCVAPDGDLFKCVRDGKAEIITDQIESFYNDGIKLKSGKKIEAEIIISATGLKLLAFGDIKITIDNIPFNPAKSTTYKGLMLSGLPNLIFFAGYTNASWTLKSDLTSEYASRLIKVMDKKNYSSFVALKNGEKMETIPLLNLNSGYINRSSNIFPKQGSKLPWRLYQNYFFDYAMLRINKIEDKFLSFI